MNENYFLKYEYRFGAKSNLDLGYDIFFYQDYFKLEKLIQSIVGDFIEKNIS